MALVAFLSDFGLADTYVAQVKAVILARCPGTQLVDVTHQVPPHDVLAGAYSLWTAVGAFAPGTIHLAIVDPGVGSDRAAVAIRSGRGDILIGPDNGLLLPAARRLGGRVTDARQILPDVAGGGPISPTFHGRDIFAPAAAFLACGAPFEQVGPLTTGLVPLPSWGPTQEHGSTIRGQVIHVDVFGNLITTIPMNLVPPLFRARLGGAEVHGPVTHYAAVPEGSILALAGSGGLLEISLRNGSAASHLGVGRGELVELWPE